MDLERLVLTGLKQGEKALFRLDPDGPLYNPDGTLYGRTGELPAWMRDMPLEPVRLEDWQKLFGIAASDEELYGRVVAREEAAREAAKERERQRCSVRFDGDRQDHYGDAAWDRYGHNMTHE